MDSEFAVYSQWRDDNISHDDSDIVDHRNLADSDLMTIAQVRHSLFVSKIISSLTSDFEQQIAEPFSHGKIVKGPSTYGVRF